MASSARLAPSHLSSLEPQPQARCCSHSGGLSLLGVSLSGNILIRYVQTWIFHGESKSLQGDNEDEPITDGDILHHSFQWCTLKITETHQ